MRTALREPSFLAGSGLIFAGALAVAVPSRAALAIVSKAGQGTTATEPIDLLGDRRRTVEQGNDTYMKGVKPTEAVIIA